MYFYAFHFMHFILCSSFYAFHSMHFILCISFSAFQSLHFIICISFYAVRCNPILPFVITGGQMDRQTDGLTLSRLELLLQLKNWAIKNVTLGNTVKWHWITKPVKNIISTPSWVGMRVINGLDYVTNLIGFILWLPP
jgi:hypothetical protein